MLQELGKISEKDGVLTRTFLSPAHIRAAEQLMDWMTDAGLRSWIDGVGNVHGELGGNGDGTQQPLLVVGSHYDTVRDGGKYDGALGIISGIAAAKTLALASALETGKLRWPQDFYGAGVDGSKEPTELRNSSTLDLDASLLRLPVSLQATSLTPLRVVGFADEEGVRFGSTYLGSRALTGRLAGSGALDARDRGGVSLAQALSARPGLEPGVDAERLGQLALDPGQVRAYVEVHMEQGPVLEAAGQPLAAVSGIAGQTRLAVVLTGQQGHAGTVPMAGRRDPLPGAAEVVLAVERRCSAGQTSRVDPGVASRKNPTTTTGLVCTVGELEPWPGASNVIPGSVRLSIDIRSQSDEERQAVVADTVQALEDICATRGLRCEWEQRHSAPAVLADAELAQALTAAIAASRALLPEQDEAPSGAVPGPLVSGAGHDAAEIAGVAPMGMMFVRCRAGVSHSPEEHVAAEDVGAATAALYTFIQADSEQAHAS